MAPMDDQDCPLFGNYPSCLAEDPNRILTVEDVEQKARILGLGVDIEAVLKDVALFAAEVRYPALLGAGPSTLDHGGLDVEGGKGPGYRRCDGQRESSVTASKLRDVPQLFPDMKAPQNGAWVEERLPIGFLGHAALAQLHLFHELRR
jgi:hypothetical protein